MVASPGSTAYSNVRAFVPLPSPVQEATALEPALSKSVGVPPVTVTASWKVTMIVILSPALYEPLTVVEATLVTTGARVSIGRLVVAETRPVRIAGFPARSVIRPPLRATAVAVTALLPASAGSTSYRK